MSWVQLGDTPIDTAKLEALIESLTRPVEIGLAAADIGVGALELVEVLALGSESVAAAALSGAVDALESSIKELLECNVSTMFHLNVNWDPAWRYADLKKNVRWPWRGTGLQGWAFDVASSLHDTSDPLRPITDADTNVWGLLFVVGVPGGEALGTMTGTFLRGFTQYDDFVGMFDPEKLEKYGEDYKALSRLGDAFLDPFVRDAVGSPNAVERMKQEWARVKPEVTDAGGYVPVAGNYPHWYAIPVVTVVPPVEGFFEGMRNIVSGLRPPLGHSALIGELAAAIRQRIAYVRLLIKRIEEAVLTITNLVNFLSTAYVYVISTEPEEGVGLDGALLAAAADPEAPDFGADGIVLGIGFFATTGSMIAPLEAFWATLGFQASAFGGEVTARAQNIEDSYGSLFAEDAP